MFTSKACNQLLMRYHRPTSLLGLRYPRLMASPKPACANFFVDALNKNINLTGKKNQISVSNSSSCESYYQYIQEIMSTNATGTNYNRMFSTAVKYSTSSIQERESTQQVLDTIVVDKMKNELDSVDTNKDGMIQPEEFRKLLRMHRTKFTEHEIESMTECFYSGTGGKGVALDRFLEALRIAALNPNDNEKVAKTLGISTCGAEYLLGSKPHAYSPEELMIELTHKVPDTFSGKMALHTTKAIRFLFDAATGWKGDIQPRNVMNRVIYLETIAAVPGMVAGILRHFKSLRAMERDGGMLNMFLEEALNERMHLLTFVKMKDPGFLMRSAVLGGQVGFGAFYGLAYMISPKFCHSFVGYVEEEACATYTKIIKAIEEAPEGSELGKWRTEAAPKIGQAYWHLGENGTVLDLMYAIRADEAEHRDVNHYASDMKKGDLAPVGNPKKQVDLALKKYVRDLMTV